MKLIKPNIIFRNSLRPLPKQNVKYIVIHHAEASKATWQDIHRWHQERGWAGAGYHQNRRSISFKRKRNGRAV